MKQTIVLSAIAFATLSTAVAQPLAVLMPDANGHSPESTTSKASVAAVNLSSTSMSIIDNYLVFNGLPENAVVKAYHSDIKENIAEIHNITPQRNSIPMRGLKKGTYLIELESTPSGGKKSFMLTLQ